MGKGEIACYEQFLLFPQCFQKACFPGASKGVIVLEWVKEQFLLFPQCFQLNQIIVYTLVYIFDIISLFAAEWDELQIGISGKG